jgi:hypothetical protein
MPINISMIPVTEHNLIIKKTTNEIASFNKIKILVLQADA